MLLAKLLLLATLIEAKRKKTDDVVLEPQIKGIEVDMEKFRDNEPGPEENGERPNIKDLTKTELENLKRPMWLNLAAIQMANLNSPRPAVALSFQNPKSYIKPDPYQFIERTIQLPKDPEAPPPVERTTCDEFAKKAVFYPEDILGIEWLPFYMWSIEKRTVAYVHKFSIPSVKLVKHYWEKYSRFIKEPIDWNQPKFVMREFVQTETLLIAIDRSGLFHGIVDLEMTDLVHVNPMNVSIDVLKIRLKIVDPYLAKMECDSHFASIMAVASAVPATRRQKIAEAAVLNLKGPGFPIARNMESEKAFLRAQQERKNHLEGLKIIKIDYKK